MGNCCTGSPTGDHPFTQQHRHSPPQINKSSPPLSTATTQSVAMTTSLFTGVGTDTPDSAVVGRSPDALIHMADREGTCMYMYIYVLHDVYEHYMSYVSM